MAPKAKITREMIVQAALEIIRENGYASLNARTIADRLNCSTQPVLYQFKTMEEIREAVYAAADELHTRYIMADIGTEKDPFLSIGLAYIRFGHDERNLFRFLFQSDRFAGMNLMAILDDPEMEPLLTLARRELGCGASEIREKFMVFVVAVHGYASLLANNTLEYDEARSIRILEMIFDGMKG